MACGLFALSACGDDGGTSSAVDAGIDTPTIDAGPADAGVLTRFAATWTLQGGCLAGDVVELEVASSSDGRVTLNRFPCADGSGISDHVGVGTFDILLRVVDTDLEMAPDAGMPDLDAGPTPPTAGPLVAISDRQLGIASQENADTAVAFAFSTGTSTISVTWSFTDGDSAQSCADVGAVNIDLEYERAGFGVERTMTRPCTDPSDESGDLPTGYYTLRAKAVDGSGNSVKPDLTSSQSLFVGNESAASSFLFGANGG